MDNKKLAKIIADQELQGEFLSAQEQAPPRIDTGIYSLNKIISGSLFEGIPGNRTVAIYGPPNSGKSFILANLVREAQKMGHIPVVADTERAVEIDYYRRIGVDPDNFVRIPTQTIEETKTKLIRAIQMIKEGFPDKQVFVGLDSLGNVPSVKELTDAEEGSEAGDMGLRAKAISALMRTVNSVITYHNVPFVFTNHVYLDPSERFGDPIRFSGGKRPVYNSHVLLLVERAKVPKNAGMPIDRSEGMVMRVTTHKNRDAPEGQSVKVLLSYRDGIYPYTDLFDDAKRFGLLDRAGAWYTFKYPDGTEEQVQGRENVLVASEQWEKILPALDEHYRDSNCYSIFDDTALDDLVQEEETDE